MGKAFIVVITVFSGIELLRPKEGIIHHMWIPLTFAGIFAYLIAHCFITVYEVSTLKRISKMKFEVFLLLLLLFSKSILLSIHR